MRIGRYGPYLQLAEGGPGAADLRGEALVLRLGAGAGGAGLTQGLLGALLVGAAQAQQGSQRISAH